MLAVLSVALLHVLCQVSPSKPLDHTQGLAERLAAATSLKDDEMLFSRGGNLPPDWQRAFDQAAKESTGDAVALRATLARAYARHLSEDELRGAVQFFESPLGASFERKYLKDPNGLKNVTADELAAVRAFAATPAGQSYGEAQNSVAHELLPAVTALGEQLKARAEVIHCRQTQDCSPLR
jgi:hypothetical protein